MFAPPKALNARRAKKPVDPYVAGVVHARQGNHELAMTFFSRIIDSGRTSGCDPYAARGASAQALGDHVRAVYDYSMAIRMEPDQPAHYTARAVSLAALHQVETLPGALHDHDAAVALVARDFSPAWHVLAGVYLARGIAREQAGKLEGAVNDLSVALDALTNGETQREDGEKSAEMGGALVKRGVCLCKLGRLKESLRDLREAVSRDANVSWYRSALAQALSATGDTAGTETQLREAVRLRPDDAELRLEHGTALWKLGFAKEASDAIAAALELAPSDPSVHLAHAQHLHRVALATGGPNRNANVEGASLAYAQAERIAMLKRDAKLQRVGRLDEEAKRASRIAKPLNLVSQADKSDAEAASTKLAKTAAEAAHGCGVALIMLERVDEAAARFEAALNLCPDRAESRLQLAMVFYALNRQMRALDELAECVRLRPEWAAARRLRAEIYRERGELGPACEEFTVALQCADGSVDDRVRRGGVRMLLGASLEAIEDFATASAQGVSPGPATLKLHMAHAAALRAVGKRKRALLELGAALRHASASLRLPYAPRSSSDSDDEEVDVKKNTKTSAAQATWEMDENERVQAEHEAMLSAIHTLRGQCLHERREYPAAVRAFDHALTLSPADGHARAMRAASYYHSGRLNLALSDVGAALASLPTTATDVRADAQQLLGMLLARTEHPWGALAALSACVYLQRDSIDNHIAIIDADEAAKQQAMKAATPATRAGASVPAPSHRAPPTMPARRQALFSTSSAGAAIAPEGHRAAPMRHRAAPKRHRQPPSLSGKLDALPAAPAPAACFALLQRGLVSVLCDRPEAADEDLTLALRLRPGWPRAHYLRGFAKKARGLYEAASSDFMCANASGVGLKVDYAHHEPLGWEALLDDADWMPLPSVFKEGDAEDVAAEDEFEDPDSIS